jgi:hypothetical protein
VRLWGVFLPLLAAAASSGQQAAITGEYIEDRANKVYGCYCEWSGEGEHAGREAVLGWNIVSGGYRGVDLAGVRMAAAIFGERTLSQGAHPRRSILLIDSAANGKQRAAAEALLRANYGALLGEIIAVRAEPIAFARERDRATMRVGTLLNVEMRRARLPEDALQGAILWYDPFVPLTESTLGTTLNVKYGGTEFDHRWQRSSEDGVTGYYGTFRIAPR